MSELAPDLSIKEGGEAYIRYCSGIDVVQHPENWSEAHLVENTRVMTEEKADAVLDYAERLMLSGLKGFIQASLPPGMKLHQARFNDQHEMAMINLVDAVCEDIRLQKRIERINSRFLIVRPNVFLRHDVFHDITRSNYARLSTIDLVDEAYAVNPALAPWISGRGVKSPRSHARSRLLNRTG